MENPAYAFFLLVLMPLLSIAGTPDGDEVRLKPLWQRLDQNGDGIVEIGELHPLQAPVMKRSDLNGDGILSLEEYASFDRDPAGSGRLPLADNVRLIPDLPYAATDDPRQSLDLYLPKEASVEGPLPVIAYVHGGAFRMGSKVMARAQLMDYIDSGRYAAVSIGYRLSWQDTWPAQIHDVKAAIRWVRANAKNYGLDASRICAMGASAGGNLVAVLGTTNGMDAVEGTLGAHTDQSSQVQCVIDLCGPSDLTVERITASGGGPTPEEMLFGGKPEDNLDKAIEASPLRHVDADDPPFLVVHGTSDPLVSYSESVALVKALRDAGVPVTFQTVEGGGHGDFGQATPEIARRIGAFLEKSFYDPAVEVPSDTLKHSPSP